MSATVPAGTKRARGEGGESVAVAAGVDTLDGVGEEAPPSSFCAKAARSSDCASSFLEAASVSAVSLLLATVASLSAAATFSAVGSNLTENGGAAGAANSTAGELPDGVDVAASLEE